MTPREKNMLIMLVGMVGLFGALFLGFQWFYKPLRELNAQIADLQDKNNMLDLEMMRFQMERPKLDLARRKSLTATPELAASDYIQFLQPLLEKKSGLKEVQIQRTGITDVKVVSPIPGVKKTGHQMITFTVNARGELGNLIKAMDLMQQTPYEHRIKNLNIDRAPSSAAKDGPTELTINMIVETLLVADTKNKPGVPLDSDLFKPTSTSTSERVYAKMVERNIFSGGRLQKKEPRQEIEPPDEYVPQYVRLSTTVPSQQTAYLRNLLYSKREEKLIAKPRSGYEEFRVAADNQYIYMQAKVLYVDARDVYFQVKHTKDVYVLHLGQSLAEAMFSKAQIDEALRETGKKSLDQSLAAELKKKPLDIFDNRLTDLGLWYDKDYAQPKKKLEKTPSSTASGTESSNTPGIMGFMKGFPKGNGSEKKGGKK